MQVTFTQKIRIVLTSLLLASLLIVVGQSNASLAGTPGVSVGDTFTYGNLSFDWFSNDPTATPPSQWSDLNQTAWIRETIQSVDGTNVTMSLLMHFSNGTEDTETNWMDVDTGEGNMTFFLTSTNLNVGDPVYTAGTYSSLTINETTPMTYPGGDRPANHVNVTMDFSSEYANVSLSMNLYWDKTTGVLTKLAIVSNQTMTYTTNYAASMQLTDSSVWVVPELGMLPVMLLLSLATLIALAARKLRRKIR